MRVLVVGATGFIGSHVSARLAGAGIETVGLARRAMRGGAPGVHRVGGDATNLGAMRGAVERCTHVVNCGPAGRAGVAVARTLRAAIGARRVVHLSSIAARAPAGVVGRVFAVAQSYGRQKRAAEVALGDGAVVLRLGCVVGPGGWQWDMVPAAALAHGALRPVKTWGERPAPLIHVRDVAEAVVSALRLPTAPVAPLHLVCPHALSWNAYFAALAEAMGLEPEPAEGWSRLVARVLAARVARRAGMPISLALPMLMADARRLALEAEARGLVDHFTSVTTDLPRASDVLRLEAAGADGALAWAMARLPRRAA